MRTTEFEFLAIREIGGALAYAAKPSGQAEAVFPLVKSSAGELVFENPTHDFPRRILYRRNPDGSVTARIEGGAAGQTRGRDFPYQKCQ